MNGFKFVILETGFCLTLTFAFYYLIFWIISSVSVILVHIILYIVMDYSVIPLIAHK